MNDSGSPSAPHSSKNTVDKAEQERECGGPFIEDVGAVEVDVIGTIAKVLSP